MKYGSKVKCTVLAAAIASVLSVSAVEAKTDNGNSVLFSGGLQSHNGNAGVDYFVGDNSFEGHAGYSSIGCYDKIVIPAIVTSGYGGYGYGGG